MSKDKKNLVVVVAAKAPKANKLEALMRRLDEPASTEKKDTYATVDWSALVSRLVEKKLVRTRMTDHEYRDDARNITHIGDEKLQHEESVDSLPCAVINKMTAFADRLIELDRTGGA